MVWPRWHYEKWETIECDNPIQVCNAIRKWVGDKWNVSVVGWLNNQAPTLDLHMSKDVFAWYLKECLLGARKTPTCVSDLLRKLITGDKIQPLSSQRVGPESEQLGVIRLGYYVMPFKMKKC
jgi:hypothetical protein